MAHLTSNTQKVYPCTQCGSSSANIIREGADPRLKCNECNFMYDASDSIAAEKAGVIPDGLPEALQQTVQTPDVAVDPDPMDTRGRGSNERIDKAPRLPTFVLLSKDRKVNEFTTAKGLKKVILRWEYEDQSFDLYELTPKKVNTKVEVKD